MPKCGPSIEIIRHDGIPAQIEHALFDFDGTLSLIRQGWQQVMVPMMVDILMQTPHHESRRELAGIVEQFVAETTGKQTIFQMMLLQDHVKQRGGQPLDALDYKRRYLDLLWERIAHRIDGLKVGRIPRDNLLVSGSVAMLDALGAHGVTCYLASGTDVEYVRDEAKALGLAGYFGNRIYGAIDDWQNYSKAMVIERILRENQLQGPRLVTFGDGFVEIENTVHVGGIAVGVASDEVHRHQVDAWKRQRLIRAGAHLIIPDFCQTERLLDLFLER